MTGDLINQATVSAYYPSFYVVGAQTGYAYFSARFPYANSAPSILAYNTDKDGMYKSVAMNLTITSPQSITICNDTIIATGLLYQHVT